MSGYCRAQCNFYPVSLSGVESEISNVSSKVSVVEAEVAAVEVAVGHVTSEVYALYQMFKEHAIKVERYHEIGIAESRIVRLQQEIEKNFSHHEEVRRIARGIVEGAHLDLIRLDSILSLAEESLMKSPSYWLPPVVLALAAWLKKDKELVTKAIEEGFRRNRSLTSLFFSLISYSAGRSDVGEQWLEIYLSMQNPRQMEKPAFVLVTMIGIGGANHGISGVIQKWLNTWIKDLSNDQSFIQGQKNYWMDFIRSSQSDSSFPENQGYLALPDHVSQWNDVIKVLNGIMLLDNSLNSFISLRSNLEFSRGGLFSEQIGKLLEGLVFSLDQEEQVFVRKKRFNEILIDYQGDREAAQRKFQTETEDEDKKIDFVSLLNPNIKNVESEEARAIARIAVSLGSRFFSPVIQESYSDLISEIPNTFTIKIGEWQGVLSKSDDVQGLRKSFENHLEQSLNEKLSSLTVSTGLRVKAGLGLVGLFSPLLNVEGVIRVFQFLSQGSSTAKTISVNPLDWLTILAGIAGLLTFLFSLNSILAIRKKRKKLMLEIQELKDSSMKKFDRIVEEFKMLENDIARAREMKDIINKKIMDIEFSSQENLDTNINASPAQRKRGLFEGTLPDWSPIPPVGS